MQTISKEILLKSLMYNTFYPKDLDRFVDKIITFSDDLNDACDAFFSKDLDEIGYARRYSKKHLFFFCQNISEDDVIKASIYGADGLLFNDKIDKSLLDLAKNCGLSLAFIAKNNLDLLKAIIKNCDIFISDEKLLKNIPENKFKGVIYAAPKSALER